MILKGIMTDFSKELRCAQNAARAAGVYQKQKWSEDFRIEFKSPINLVTEVDKASEKMIVATISEHFPDHDILAEEGSDRASGSVCKWIIDPLDGTTNFAHRYPLWCVSIALEKNDQIVLGVVYDPVKDEMFHAVRGQGAFLNGKPIRVSTQATLATALMSTGFPYNVRESLPMHMAKFSDMLMQAQSVRRDGVAAIDLCYVACGRYDGFWELGLFAWDVAAGWVILEEAGGKITKFNGHTARVYDKEICATNARIHTEVVAVLTKP